MKYFLLIIFVLIIWAVVVEPNILVVKRITIKNKDLSGLKVVFASDFHIKPYERYRLRRIIKTINKQNPDVILLGGDYVNGHNPGFTLLPEDIVVVDSKEVPGDWHPRYQDRIRKTYEYHIYNAPVPNPLRRRYTSYVSFPLDVEKMQEGASYLEGEHDFVSFCNVRTQVEDTVRTVEKLEISREGPEIVIRITGNGFLYNMVRILVGTLLEVGRGEREPETISALFGKRRELAGQTVPACGLCLMEVKY